MVLSSHYFLYVPVDISPACIHDHSGWSHSSQDISWRPQWVFWIQSWALEQPDPGLGDLQHNISTKLLLMLIQVTNKDCWSGGRCPPSSHTIKCLESQSSLDKYASGSVDLWRSGTDTDVFGHGNEGQNHLCETIVKVLHYETATRGKKLHFFSSSHSPFFYQHRDIMCLTSTAAFTGNNSQPFSPWVTFNITHFATILLEITAVNVKNDSSASWYQQ